MSPRRTITTRTVRTRTTVPEALPALERMKRNAERNRPAERQDHYDNPLAEEELVKEDATHGD